MIRAVENFEELVEATRGLKGTAIVGFFGDFSDKSRAAWPNFQAFCARHPDLPVFLVDVARVKDVHRRLGVTLVPTVAFLKDGTVVQQVVGVRTVAEYEASLSGQARTGSSSSTGSSRPSHRVLVYTGASCPWCTRVKAYLRQRNVPFTEIDVSRDPAAAQALVRKTGQTGVPQLDIDGRYVIGFDKARIDALLGLGPQGGNPELYR